MQVLPVQLMAVSSQVPQMTSQFKQVPALRYFPAAQAVQLVAEPLQAVQATLQTTQAVPLKYSPTVQQTPPSENLPAGHSRHKGLAALQVVQVAPTTTSPSGQQTPFHKAS